MIRRLEELLNNEVDKCIMILGKCLTLFVMSKDINAQGKQCKGKNKQDHEEDPN